MTNTYNNSSTTTSSGDDESDAIVDRYTAGLPNGRAFQHNATSTDDHVSSEAESGAETPTGEFCREYDNIIILDFIVAGQRVNQLNEVRLVHITQSIHHVHRVNQLYKSKRWTDLSTQSC